MSLPDYQLPEGYNPIFGADGAEVRSLLWNCNPYERACLFAGAGPYNKPLGMLLNWLMAAGLVYVHRRQMQKLELLGYIYFDNLFPFVHLPDSYRLFLVLWLVMVASQFLTGGWLVFMGLLNQVLMSTDRTRLQFVYAINIKMYAWLFGEWLLLLAIGYLIFFRERYGLDSDEAYAFYKVFFVTMSAGGVFLSTASTVRLWYWDGYYQRKYRREMDAKWEQMEEFGYDPDVDYWTLDERQNEIDFLL